MAEWSETSSIPESSIGSVARAARVLAPGQINGYLLKKSTHGVWQRRFFETNGTFLTYYKSSKMTKLLAAMSLPQVGDIRLMGEIEDDKGKGYLFQIDLMDRVYVLRALTKEEAVRWVTALGKLKNDPARKAKEAEEAAIRAAQKPTAKVEKMSSSKCCMIC